MTRAFAAIAAVFSSRRAQLAAGAAVATLLLVTAISFRSGSVAAASTREDANAARPSAAPVTSTPVAPALADSSSRIVRTAAGSIALHPTAAASSQSSSSRLTESRAENSSRRNVVDDAPSLDINHNVKLTAPTIALGQADSIAHASEAPSKLVEGSFSRQFWTAGIDKKAGTESTNSPTPAKLIGDMPHPIYPEFLRKNSVEGEVVVRFVIDVTGRPDMATFEVVRTPHDAMTAAVRRVVQQMRFQPARSGGPDSSARTELVQISFVFQADPK